MTISGVFIVLLSEICSVSMPGVDAVTFTCSRTICSWASTTLHAALACFDSALVGLVKSGLLHLKPVRFLLPQRVSAVSRVIRPQVRRFQSWLRDRYLRAWNRHAVLVDHGHGDWGPQRRGFVAGVDDGRAKVLLLPAGDYGAEEKKQTRHGPPDAFKTRHEDKSEPASAVPPRCQYSAGLFPASHTE